MWRNPSFLLLALAPVLAQAQAFLPTDTIDTDSLRAFERRMLAEPVRSGPAGPLNEYVMVWREHIEGDFMTIEEGDGTITLDSVLPGEGRYPLGEDPIYYGERYTVLVRDVPVSMVDWTRWHFERR